jgi:hypothetical protein
MEPDKTPDEYQQAWQAHSSQTRITIDADLLRKEVLRDQQTFRAIIICRDFREVFVALLLIPVWFYMGARIALPWTWYLTVPALLWIAGFMLAYRRRHPQRPSELDEPLLACVKNSLAQQEDQIWLLRNVFWWYLLPPGMTMMAFFIHVSWNTAVITHDWLGGVIFAALLFAILFGVDYFIYRLNQKAVHIQLEPRRQELLALVASLSDEAPSEVTGEYQSD